jgi:hypothetical protein
VPLVNYETARPFLYHLTHRANLARLRETSRLFPVAVLLQNAQRNDLLRARRPESIAVRMGEIVVWIRDQAPLREGNIRFSNGYTFGDLIESLNRRIFFWPGLGAKPISYGMRHFERYESEKPVVLRIGFEALLRANPGVAPRFCRYNSGSPRCSNGKRSPRGPDTFLLAQDFHETASKVVEVTFDTEIRLPQDTEFGETPKGPWRLFV